MPVRATPILRWTHRWLGLLFGGLFLLSSLSGAVLVFGHEIDQALHPDLFRASPGPSVGLDQALRNARAAVPGLEARLLATPVGPLGNGVYLVRLGTAPETDVFIDPGTGQVLGVRRRDHGPIGWLTALHVNLCAGRAGAYLLGGAGVVLLVMILTGVYLGWRSGWGLAGCCTVRRGRGAFLLVYDLHRAVGTLAAPLLGLIALTGALFALNLAGPVIYGLFFRSPPGPPPVASAGARQRLGEPLTLEQCRRVAEDAVPGSTVTFLSLPPGADGPVTFRLRQPDSPHPNGCSSVAIDQYTSGVVWKRDERDFALPDRLRSKWLFCLHIGSYGGLTSRLLHVVVGLVPGVLLGTGLFLWRRRASRARNGTGRSRAAPPAGGRGPDSAVLAGEPQPACPRPGEG